MQIFSFFIHKTRLPKGEELRISGVRVGAPPSVYIECSMFVAAAQLFPPNGDRCSFAHLIVIAAAAAARATRRRRLLFTVSEEEGVCAMSIVHCHVHD